jgi:[ribosomal protein S5]-alanine N-acetyltransferase
VIVSERLDLIPATPALLRAPFLGREALARALSATVSEGWLPDSYGGGTPLELLQRLEANPTERGWGLHYFVSRSIGKEPPCLVGCGGYRGPPSGGQVEIGYAVLPEFRRRGFATEAAFALVRGAFRAPDVDRVVAHAREENAPSIQVLARCGFDPLPGAKEAGVTWFGISRSTFETAWWTTGRARAASPGAAREE